MSLLELPNEIILLIAESLNSTCPTDLNSFCQTNRHLASLLAPLLHNFALQTRYGIVALHWGVATGNEPLVRFVMEKTGGIQIKYPSANGRPTEIYNFPADFSEEVVQLVMERGARVIVRELGGSQLTSLHQALSCHQGTLVRSLLAKGAFANELDFYGVTALHVAAIYNDHESIELLVANGADLEARLDEGVRDDMEQTALHLAVEENYQAVVRELLKTGADIGAQDAMGRTALHLAADLKDESLVKMLLRNGAPLDIEDDSLDTPFDVAWSVGHRPTIILLLEYANEDFRTYNEETALHIASRENYKGLVRKLVDGEIDIDLRNGSGQTALHLAVANGNYEIAETLMTMGADAEMVDLVSGCTTLELARSNGQSGQRMVRFISKFGANEDRALEHFIEGHQRRRW